MVIHFNVAIVWAPLDDVRAVAVRPVPVAPHALPLPHSLLVKDKGYLVPEVENIQYDTPHHLLIVRPNVILYVAAEIRSERTE